MTPKHLSRPPIAAAINATCLLLVALLCLLPLINVTAISLSSSAAAAAGEVGLLPVGLNFSSYLYVLERPEFWRSFMIAVERVVLGFAINIVLCALVAFPLSKKPSEFRGRTLYLWFFVLSMLFTGGLIPTYMTLRAFGALDTIWALVLPGAVPVFSVLIMMNFFRELPEEIEEAAVIDGAGYWVILTRIVLPLSLPVIATISLFSIVGHWNSWFDGLIYMNSPERYPLQSYLQNIVVGADLNHLSSGDFARLSEISDRTFKAAQIIFASLPVVLIYLFLQKYLIKGLVMGSVKG